jgi:hypothetical protein
LLTVGGRTSHEGIQTHSAGATANLVLHKGICLRFVGSPGRFLLVPRAIARLLTVCAEANVIGPLVDLLESRVALTQRASALALANICATEPARMKLVDGGALDALVPLVTGSDPALQVQALRAISDLAAGDVTRDRVAATGIVPRLVQIYAGERGTPHVSKGNRNGC